MNILFITYGDFRSNSLNHIAVFAEGLVSRGHACCVAVPHGLAERVLIPQEGFSARLHSELTNKPLHFPDGRHADIIHAWTPRIGVLETLLGYQRSIKSPARVVVHLEDNERHLLAQTADLPFERLLGLSDRQLRWILAKGLAHPVRHQLLLSAADLVTVITPKLEAFVPVGTPFAYLPPAVAPRFFQPQLLNLGLREQLGLGSLDRVIVYPGGANHTNANELRSLYAAVVLLNQRGFAVKLVRTGPPTPWFTASLTTAERENVIELGFVAREIIPQLLSLADVLVQPGCPGSFNDFRLPSKIPEFLASGRPVVLPATNIAQQMRDGHEAVFLNQGSPEDIANCCEQIFNNPALAINLGSAGRAFAEKHFDFAVNSSRLVALYEEMLARPPAADWLRIRRWGHDEADLFPLASSQLTPLDVLELARQRRTRWQHRIGSLTRTPIIA